MSRSHFVARARRPLADGQAHDKREPGPQTQVATNDEVLAERAGAARARPAAEVTTSCWAIRPAWTPFRPRCSRGSWPIYPMLSATKIVEECKIASAPDRRAPLSGRVESCDVSIKIVDVISALGTYDVTEDEPHALAPVE